MEVGIGPNGLIFQLLVMDIQDIELLGVDLDTHILEYLRSIGVNNFQVDISSEKLPIVDGNIDIIIFNEVIEHVFDCQHAINEIYRVLRK